MLQLHAPCRYPQWIFGHLLGLHLLLQGHAPSFRAFCWLISIPPKIPTYPYYSFSGPRLHVCSSILWLCDYLQVDLLVCFTHVLHRTHCFQYHLRHNNAAHLPPEGGTAHIPAATAKWITSNQPQTQLAKVCSGSTTIPHTPLLLIEGLLLDHQMKTGVLGLAVLYFLNSIHSLLKFYGWRW